MPISSQFWTVMDEECILQTLVPAPHNAQTAQTAQTSNQRWFFAPHHNDDARIAHIAQVMTDMVQQIRETSGARYMNDLVDSLTYGNSPRMMIYDEPSNHTETSMDIQLFINTQVAKTEDMRIMNVYRERFPLQTDILQDAYVDEATRYTRGSQFHHDWQRQRAAMIDNYRNMLYRNMTSCDLPPHRLEGLTRSRRVTVTELFKSISVVVRENDNEEVCSLLNTLRSIKQSLARRVHHKINDLFDLSMTECDDCGEFVNDDSWGTTYNDRHVCHSCLESHYVYSECQDVYISEGVACSVYQSEREWNNGSPSDYCTRRYGNNNFFEHNDGGFFTDEDDLTECSEYDEEQDEDGSYRHAPDYLPDWHSADKDFCIKNASGKYPALGVELEIYVPERRDFVIATREAGIDVIMERDGSLCGHHGIELISHPLGREEWEVLAPELFDHIHEHKGIGYNEPAGDKYGIHVTVDRAHMSPLAEARLSMLLVDTDNADFVRAISQRNQIYCPEHGIGFGGASNVRLAHISNDSCDVYNNIRKKYEKKIYGRGKYCPINFKGNLAEFRIFQSTTNIESFMKNLEFVWALIKWTKPQTASGNSHSHRDFLMWLNKRQQRHEFPHLTEFLSKRVFYSTNSPPIVSTWQDLMTKPNELEAVELMAA